MLQLLEATTVQQVFGVGSASPSMGICGKVPGRKGVSDCLRAVRAQLGGGKAVADPTFSMGLLVEWLLLG